MKAVHAGPRASALRDVRFRSASNVVKLARDAEVDFVLIAGDTFEHPDVDEVVVRRTVDILNQFAPIPVFILPGNHDPVGSGSVWRRESWKRVEPHVTLCDRPEPLELDEGSLLYPCPLTQKQSGADPTSWVPPRDQGDDRIRIGLAHGGLAILPTTPNFPILPTRAEESGLDYLALGDWHGFHQHGKAVYPGTMEATSFSEVDPGHVLIVDIGSAGAAPNIDKKEVHELRWRDFSLDIRDESDVQLFEHQIKELGDLATAVLKVTIRETSQVSESASARLASIRAVLLQEAFYADWPSDPQPSEESESADAEYPGVFANVHGDLASIARGDIPEGPGRPFASAEPAVVRSAMSLLRRILREADS